MSLSSSRHNQLQALIFRMKSDGASDDDMAYIADAFEKKHAEPSGVIGALFPRTQQTAQAAPDEPPVPGPMYGMGGPEAHKEWLVMADDIFSFTTRAAEGLKRMLTGQGAEGMRSALQDPEASVFQNTREADAAFWNDLAEKSDNAAEKGLFKTLGFMNSAGWGALEDPTTLLFPLKKIVDQIPGAIPLKGVAKRELVSSGGLPLTPAQAAGQERSLFESYAQANPFTEDIPLNIRNRQVEKIQQTASKISKDMGGVPVEQLGESRSVRGSLIEEKAKDFKNINQKLFAEGEALIQKAVGQKPINFKEFDVFGPSKTGLVDQYGKPIKSVVDRVVKTNAMEKMKEMLGRIGHEIGTEPQNIRGISKNAIKTSQRFYGDIKAARNVNDLLNVKRNIAGEVFDDVQKGLFSGEKDISFLRGINKQMNDALEESIVALSPGVGGEQLADAFRSMNKQYESNLDALSTPAKKLGIGRQDFKPEDVLGKIKLIGSKNLNKIKEAAKKKPEIKPIYEELQRGAYEDLIFKSLNKNTMQISPDKLASAWNSMDGGFKKSIFPPNVIGEVDKLVRTLQKISSGDLAKMNPSGTGKVNFLTRVFTHPVDAATALLGYPVAKWYYKTGKLPHQSAWNLIRGDSGKIYLNSNKMAKMRNAQSLGNFIRSELNVGGNE